MSIVIHAGLLATFGWMLRAMPPTVARTGAAMAPPLLQAVLISPPIAMIAMPQGLPLLTPTPLPMAMLPAPLLPEPAPAPMRTTTLEGIAVDAATIAAPLDLIPVGRITYTQGDRGRRFGNDLTSIMTADYPRFPSRLPSLNGALSIRYPTKAASEGRGISMAVLVMLSADGHVVGTKVAPSDPEFAMAVLTALRNALFKPATLNGEPMAYWTAMTFNFSIDQPTGRDGRPLNP
jgi:TonB family protein